MTLISNDYITRIFDQQVAKRDRAVRNTEGGHFHLQKMSITRIMSDRDIENNSFAVTVFRIILLYHRKKMIIRYI